MSANASEGDSPLSILLSRDALFCAAGARSFERGEEYFSRGQVRSLVEYKGTLTARVQGTEPYQVKLWAESGILRYFCTCPVGQDGIFCKHCVAVGLAWCAQPYQLAVDMNHARAYLAGQEKDTLVDMLMDQAMDDERLRLRLLRKAATQLRGPDLAAYRQMIDRAVDIDNYVEEDGGYQYASGIQEAVDAIADLLQAGHASAVIDLAEHAFKAIEEAMQSVEVFDGRLNGVLERLQEMHLEACGEAALDPEELARRLFTWELHTDGDILHDAVDTYAGILGERGLAVYRQLAEAEWAQVPSLGPGSNLWEGSGNRYRITRIMETLARRTGDLEAIVAVKKHDLSLPRAYLQIAETYQRGGKHDLALEWAERGIAAFPGLTEFQLREFLAAEYHRRNRHDEAMALIWARFAGSPTFDQYRHLKSHADQAGQWEVWRPKALDVIRGSIVTRKQEPRGPWWGGPLGADELVRVFLWEGDTETAWREAQEGGCSDGLLMELARKRERDHPEDALIVYRQRIEAMLSWANSAVYQEAVEILQQIQGVMAHLGRSSEFARYFQSVRATHKRKRNFMKLLDREKWA